MRFLYDKQLLQIVTSSFLVFSLLQHQQEFCQKSYEKTTFLRRIFKVLPKLHYPKKICNLPTVTVK